MTATPYRWYPHNGERHAIPLRAPVGQETTTLCEQRLIVEGSRKVGRERECPSCDGAWRVIEGIPPQKQRQAPLTDVLGRASADMPAEAKS